MGGAVKVHRYSLLFNQISYLTRKSVRLPGAGTNQLEKGRHATALYRSTTREVSDDLRQQGDAVDRCGNAETLAIRLLHSHNRGFAESPSTRPQTHAWGQHDH
jgi:hypothetical protein